MNKLFKQKPSLFDKIKLYKIYIYIFIALVLFISYLFVILFGNKSVLVLLELKEEERELEQSVKFYEQQNAYLQKEIFEIGGE